MAYLDHAATTPVRPEARDAMLPWLGDRTGNPSGAHRLARDARRAIDDARDVFAELTGFAPGDIVFTAGGTEADNLAVLGVAGATGGAVVCPTTEHHAVLEPVEGLPEGRGLVVPVLGDGSVDLDALAAVLDEHAGGAGPAVALVSAMTANNETGIVADLDAIVAVVRDRTPDALVHTDAVQALTWLDLASRTDGVDLLSLSAHKFGGPQGVGVLAVRPDVPLAARTVGGGQERGRRSGTQNVAGIVGAAAAARVAADTRAATVARLRDLRDRLLDGLHARIPGLVETGGPDRDRRIAGTAHVCIPGVEAETLLVLLEDAEVYASAASSCSSGAQDPSHVLAAMGIDRTTAGGSLRLSLGWSTTEADVAHALEVVPAAVERLQAFSVVTP